MATLVIPDSVPSPVEDAEKIRIAVQGDGLHRFDNPLYSENVSEENPQQEEETPNNEVPSNGDQFTTSVGDSLTSQTGNLTNNNSNITEESEDPLILKKMKCVGIGVVTIGTSGTFAFMQVNAKNIESHILKYIHFASNFSLGASSLIAAIVVLIICIISPKSSRSIKKLKYALRLAILLVVMGYVLALAFILQQD